MKPTTFLASLAVLIAAAPALSQPAPAPGYGFEVELTFSPRAQALLARRPQTLDLVAFYEGDPVRGREALAEGHPLGKIELGSETVKIPARAGRYRITGSQVDRRQVRFVRAVEAGVNVSHMAYFPRAGVAETLACDLPALRFPRAATPVRVHCRSTLEVR